MSAGPDPAAPEGARLVVVELHLDDGRVLVGEVPSAGARLLDLLNGPGEALTLRRALGGAGRGGAVRPLGEVAVPKVRILLALPYDAGELRPLALQRDWRPTARARIAGAAGPFAVRGVLHGPSGDGDPLAALLAGRERRAFLPLTAATVEHRDGWSLRRPAVFVPRAALADPVAAEGDRSGAGASPLDRAATPARTPLAGPAHPSIEV